MSIFKTLFAALALVSASIVVAAPIATAQGANIIVIDEGRILRDSKAGKDLQNKLKNIQAQIKRELEPTAKSLETEGKSLEARAKGKTAEQLRADTSLVNSITSFRRKQNEFARKSQIASQEYMLTERKGLQEFNKILEPVLNDVIKEKNAQIVLSRSAVVFSGPSVDATQAVISKLDQRSPSVSVSRQRLPAK